MGKGLAPGQAVVAPLQQTGHPGEAGRGLRIALTFWVLVEAGDVLTGVAAHRLGADASPDLLRV